MRLNVDPKKVDELSGEFNRVRTTIEDGETGISNQIRNLLQITNLQYKESYVRSTTSEMGSLLAEINKLAQRVTANLNSKSNALKQAANRYRKDEADIKTKVKSTSETSYW